MKDQHKKISGYRDLTQEEIDLMNKAKRLEAEVLELHREVGAKILQQYRTAHTEEHVRAEQAQAQRWHSIARTDIETGFMALVRSVAQPQPL